MPLVSRVRRKTYVDSLVLMRVATNVREIPGVIDVIIMMGTPKNKAIILKNRPLTDEVESAGSEDILFLIEAETEKIANQGLDEAEQLLFSSSSVSSLQKDLVLTRFRSLQGAISGLSDANMALFSIPGPYVKDEALRALRRGLNVMIFSDNVPLEAEVEIKRTARDLGLLVMGPDCGTALIHGIGLGFANQVNRGPVGIVGASGTGIQEVACLVDRWGSGVSHAIGTGSNDVKAEVGGITMQNGIDLLVNDALTRVIVLIAKPPAPAVQSVLLDKIRNCPKPIIVHFQGADMRDIQEGGAKPAATLAETAALAVESCSGGAEFRLDTGDGALGLARAAWRGLKKEQTLVRGVFAGGTFCGEAAGVIQKELGRVYTNTGYPGTLPLTDQGCSMGHACIDLGDDQFTAGRPHPMLEPVVCRDRILLEAANPRAAVLLLDVVLGYGVHPDPAGVLVPVLEKAREQAEAEGRNLAIVAHVCGTDRDPQVRSKQVEKLHRAGVLVASTNAEAASLACRIVQRS